MYNIKAIPEQIRQARLYRNYSQEYLAYRLNISQNGYSKIELGYTQLSLERFLKIADVLELGVLQLLEGTLDANGSLQIAGNG